MFTGDYDALVEHLRGFRVRDLEITEAPLDDVFMRFYGADGDGPDEDESDEEAANLEGTDEDPTDEGREAAE
jgi:ABC-2 type transport system ATP-binding protein